MTEGKRVPHEGGVNDAFGSSGVQVVQVNMLGDSTRWLYFYRCCGMKNGCRVISGNERVHKDIIDRLNGSGRNLSSLRHERGVKESSGGVYPRRKI